jgi:hypothetical protein
MPGLSFGGIKGDTCGGSKKKEPVQNKGKKSTNPPANTRETELPISSKIFFENDNVVGKNGFKWQSKCNLIPSTSKICQKILYILHQDY